MRNDRVDQICKQIGPTLEKMIPEDLSKYPDFPEFLEGMSQQDYTQIVEEYWTNKRKY